MTEAVTRRFPEHWRDQMRRGDKARRRAMAELRARHSDEYQEIYVPIALGLGITPRSLMGGPIRKRRRASSG